MMDKTDFMLLSITVICQWVFAVCMWQIEEIWRSLQNDWVYNLPWGAWTRDYWGSHDWLFVFMFAAMIVQALCVVYAVGKGRRASL